MNIALVIQYLGTSYKGWQRQINLPSVQEEIEKAVFHITGEKINLTGSGRTDAGVHALGQVANFITETDIPAEKFSQALNHFLPNDIRIVQSIEVFDSFNARYHAKRKTYMYVIDNSSVESPFLHGRSCFVPKKLDIHKMKGALEILVGTHDFSSFKAEGSFTKTDIRTIFNAEIKKEKNIIKIFITGDGFLYNMIRIISGTLIGIGKGKDYNILNILEKKSRSFAGQTAPACGLFLYSVEYENIPLICFKNDEIIMF